MSFPTSDTQQQFKNKYHFAAYASLVAWSFGLLLDLALDPSRSNIPACRLNPTMSFQSVIINKLLNTVVATRVCLHLHFLLADLTKYPLESCASAVWLTPTIDFQSFIINELLATVLAMFICVHFQLLLAYFVTHPFWSCASAHWLTPAMGFQRFIIEEPLATSVATSVGVQLHLLLGYHILHPCWSCPSAVWLVPAMGFQIWIIRELLATPVAPCVLGVQLHFLLLKHLMSCPCWSCVCIGIVWQQQFHGVTPVHYLDQSKSNADLKPHGLQRLANQYTILTPPRMPRAIKIFTQLVHAMCALFVRQTHHQPVQFQFKEHVVRACINLRIYKIFEKQFKSSWPPPKSPDGNCNYIHK